MSMRRASGGFSLVELMVALTLSLVLMAGALSILYSSRLTYSENERIARLQEAGRTTLELILRDVRAAGFNGCTRPDPTKYNNGLTNPTTLLWNFVQPLFGYDAASGAWAPALDTTNMPSATTGSDVVLIRTSRQGQPVFRLNAPTTDPTADLSVNRDVTATIAAGTTMVISDCEYTSVFVATGFAGAGTTATISHAMGGGPPSNNTNSVTSNFLIDSQVMPIDTIAYYVRDSSSGNGPALWQKIGAAAPALLIEGVENMQLQYGIDTDGDLLVNQYVTANNVTNWSNVVAMSIAVLVRSAVQDGVDTDGRTYSLLGTNFGPFTDRRQRTVFTTTVALRNGAS